jgi:hypothetical protein
VENLDSVMRGETEAWEKCAIRSFIIWILNHMIKLRTVKWAGHVASMGNAYIILMRRVKEKRSLGGPRYK